ncbi:hypothetical protein DPEC_G00154450 [Dallia pectoralis]|uniref:Uncharacterized protein n=1 Tax=Dallia pectoralis TaxID=75939 RepID=A0ACC2GJT1_DALPE|nr:hypothetical protein DPEC_G00154450 [Dallia pectoralis]
MEGTMDPKDAIIPEPRDDRVSEPDNRSGIEPQDVIGVEVCVNIIRELQDRVFTDPEGSDTEGSVDGILSEPEDREEAQDVKVEENIFAAWKRTAEQENPDQEMRQGEAAIVERKSSFDPQTHHRLIHALTAINHYHVWPNSRLCLASTNSELAELPKMKVQMLFRRRNVLSLSDADCVCLICHGDLHRRGGGVRELHCSHSFHIECIEEWLWRKQTCPTCCVRLPVPEPLYWSSTRIKVP